MVNQDEKENQRLKDELDKVSKSEHEKTVWIKLISFLAVAAAAGYVQTISPIAALVIAAVAFWFIFVR